MSNDKTTCCNGDCNQGRACPVRLGTHKPAEAVHEISEPEASSADAIIDLALKYGASSYRNRADTNHWSYGFTEAGLVAFAQELMAGKCLQQIAEPAKFFSYSGECGIETHATEAEAKAACQEMIDACRDEAADGWPDDVDTIIWGIVLGETKERILGEVEDPVASGFDYHAEYDLVPTALAAVQAAAKEGAQQG